jgi:photosystem II stability/assembly factor-like uncharacterized protein
MLAPPRPPSRDELEALIREARARQRRRRIVRAAAGAAALGVALALQAAVAGGGATGHAAAGNAAATASSAGETSRVQILRVGSSGGVTWALNGRGMWLTTNGGRTWRVSTPPAVRRLGDAADRIAQVTFLDRRHGWLLAVNVNAPRWTKRAAFYRTSDGGRTWHRSTPKGCCGAFSFVTPRLGFFSGNSALYETRNGGATWKSVAGRNYPGTKSVPGRNYYPGIPTLVDARHGVQLVDGGLQRTADGGHHWKTVLLSGQPPAAGNGLFVNDGPTASFGHRLVLTAERPSSSDPGDIQIVPYVSSDAGASWTARPFPRWWRSYVGNNDGVRFSAASPNVWIAAALQRLAVTADAGRTWRLVRVAGMPAHSEIGAIDFTSPGVGWAIFNGPRSSVLMRTTDAGGHWAPAGPPRPKPHRH